MTFVIWPDTDFTLEPCIFTLNIFQDFLFTYFKQKQQCPCNTYPQELTKQKFTVESVGKTFLMYVQWHQIAMKLGVHLNFHIFLFSARDLTDNEELSFYEQCLTNLDVDLHSSLSPPFSNSSVHPLPSAHSRDPDLFILTIIICLPFSFNKSTTVQLMISVQLPPVLCFV